MGAADASPFPSEAMQLPETFNMPELTKPTMSAAPRLAATDQALPGNKTASQPQKHRPDSMIRNVVCLMTAVASLASSMNEASAATLAISYAGCATATTIT